MEKIIFLFLPFLVSFYSLSFNHSNGTFVNTSTFGGKKVLFVNIATGSARSSQLQSLQELQNQFSDSLVVVAFPSNSFGNEVRSDEQIRTYCQTTYGATFLIAQKSAVTGDSLSAVYGWLTDSTRNGITSQPILADYQKFLISSQGELIGIFGPSVLPTDSLILQAITRH